MTQYTNKALKEVLGKGWLTHDAMWVQAVYEACGAEIANQLNQRAIVMMVPIEAKRLAKVFEFNEGAKFEDLKRLVLGALDMIAGDFTDFEVSFPGHNQLHWNTRRCFAHDGIKRIGMIEQYECGIFERVEGWFKALGVKYDVLPKVTGCMMHTQGRCYRDIQFYFNE